MSIPTQTFRSCENKGFQMFFENKWGVSVQFGPGNYCDRRDFGDYTSNPRPGIWESATAEVAVFKPDGELLRVGNDTVMGWLRTNLVGQIISVVCSLAGDADPQIVTDRMEGLVTVDSFRKSGA